MSQYSYAQLEQLWINAGGSTALAPVMAAIAMAESGGRSDAYNASGASGLWQILGAVNPADQGNLFDPTTNAHEAVLKYNSQGLGAWVTYTSGAYLQFMQGNTPPSGGNVTGRTGKDLSASGASASGGGPFSWFNFISSGIIGNLLQPGSGYVGSGTSPLGPIGDLSQNFGALVYDIGQGMKWISWLFAPANWLRIGAFFVGIATFIGGLYMLKEAV